jgi:N-acetylglucosamine-6-phosphate deacetylase
LKRLSASRVLTSGGWLESATVTVADGRILEIGPARGTPPERVLIPGLVDLQCNGIEDINVAGAAGADWDRLDGLLVSRGVTTWCPTLITSPLDEYGPALERIAAAARDRPLKAAPSIAGAHLEGPFLGTATGAHDPSLVRPIDLAWLASLPPIVKIVTLGPEQPGAAAAIRALSASGVLVALGHTEAARSVILEASAAGARLVTHLFNGMAPFHHRSPGPVAAGLLDDNLSCSVIADGHHVHADALALAWRVKGPHRMVLISDAVAWAAGQLGGAPLEEVDGVPRRPDGTLAGSRQTLDAAVRFAVEGVGLPLEVAVRAAATNPARLLGLNDRGSLASGQRADIVALTPSLEVEGTWVAGQPVFP